MLPDRYQRFLTDISALVPQGRLFTDPLRTLAYGTDASFYRLIPKIVVRADTEAEVAAILKAADHARHPGHLPRRGDKPFGPGGVRLGAHRGRRQLEPLRDHRQRRRHPAAARCHRRARQPLSRPLRPQDRPRPGLHQLGHDRRHRRQQRQRHVLRHRPEQLPHGHRHAHPLSGRHPARHRRPRQPRRIPLRPQGPARRGRCPRQRGACQHGPGGAHSPQIQDQEHHRVQPQRPGGLRGPLRHPAAPDDRLRGHAGVHLRDHLSDRGRTPLQGERPHDLPPDRERRRPPRPFCATSRWPRSNSWTAPPCGRSRTRPGCRTT